MSAVLFVLTVLVGGYELYKVATLQEPLGFADCVAIIVAEISLFTLIKGL